MQLRDHLLQGQVIPAHPLALTANHKLDERHQRALTRYYLASGAGGIAVGVHTTQFEIRQPQHALLKPVLELAAQTADEELQKSPRPFAKIAGICGQTAQAISEAELARELNYNAGLLSLAAWSDADEAAILKHCRTVADVIPIVGFYLQPAVGGRVLPYSFWRAFADIESVVAIKIAPFNRYQTLDVVRAVIEAGRDDIALYTGNDDNIIVDLLTRFQFKREGQLVERYIVGGLLGHWAVWTRGAVQLLDEIKTARTKNVIAADWLTRAQQTTDANAVLFDAAHNFAGCIPGIHEVLHRQGLLRGIWCLNPNETLSTGQSDEIDRVTQAYPELNDEEFVRTHLDEWLRP